MDHLSPSAGTVLQAQPEKASPAPPAPARAPREYVRWSESLTRESLEKTLAEHSGNVSRAARSLGMARSQMYREMARLSLTRPTSDED